MNVERFGLAPVNTGAIGEANISAYRFVVQAGEALNFDATTEVRFDVSTLEGVNTPSEITVYRRDFEGFGAFESLETNYDMDTNELLITTSEFSEFVLASDSNPLPVELTHFTATRSENAVTLHWETRSENGLCHRLKAIQAG